MTRQLNYKSTIYKLWDTLFISQRLASFTLRGKRLFLLSIVLLIVAHTSLFAQEVLRGLTVNPELVKIKHDKTDSKRQKAALAITADTIPFVDDFSTTSVYPDPKLWLDKKVYINSTYPVNPVTIGVATFDALDENGYLYKNASASPFGADTLTSKPFDFKNIKIDSLYFSFFYEAQGIGDKPEVGDQLIVEFYSPDSAKWKKILSLPNDSVSHFKQIPPILVNKEYQKNGFQFRFRNLASIDSSDVAGRHGNVDLWHIDYVRLDTGHRINFNNLRDIAFVKPLTSLLQTYQSIPWDQYAVAFRFELKPTIDITYRNNWDTAAFVYKDFIIKEITPNNAGNTVIIPESGKSIEANTTLTIQTDLFDPFVAKYPGNLVQFDVEAYIRGQGDKRHENDTIHYRQVFSNYFSYDDGSSETGYGIIGEGAQNASVAYQFKTYKPDTLVGISFYFNPTEKDTTTTSPFKLAVWDDNNGTPGKLIYEKDNDALIHPVKASRNQFFNFELDSGINIFGKFYVGFIQKSADFLNIGFDLNNNNQRFLFVNLNGVWVNSSKAGSLMINPVFGNIKPGLVTGNKTIKSQSFIVFPNPADNLIYINTGIDNNSPLSASIYDLTGRLVLSAYIQDNKLDISNLSNGLYILKVAGEKTNFSPVKLLIKR